MKRLSILNILSIIFTLISVLFAIQQCLLIYITKVALVLVFPRCNFLCDIYYY